MGLLDTVLGSIGGSSSSSGGGGIDVSSLIGLLSNSGGGADGQNSAGAAGAGAAAGGGALGSLLMQLAGNGLGDKIQSWVGSGENQNLTADETRKALGEETVQRAADQMGVSKDQAADMLAQALPQAVDQMTPEGHLRDEDKPANWKQEDWF